MSITAKTERIDLRISSEAKELIEAAAQLVNLSLSSYIISVCIKQARLDLKEQETLILSNTDRDLILKALEDPSKPNQALKDLFKQWYLHP